MQSKVSQWKGHMGQSSGGFQMLSFHLSFFSGVMDSVNSSWYRYVTTTHMEYRQLNKLIQTLVSKGFCWDSITQIWLTAYVADLSLQPLLRLS